ncbi:MAG TPA: SRPBCC domain-containing protein [Cytophagaceae bacterium]|jgi:hypothetical protein|nr:SRPBCC domain-containing protein [Cytophagaceae bacterium]
MAKDFTFALLTDKTPEEVFQIVCNVRQWWSGLYAESFEGPSDQLHKEFSYRAGEGAHYTKQKLVELIPNQKVVWQVTHSELSFLKHPEEWEGTQLVFDISKKGKQTEVRFTHQGLVPSMECYEACAPAWTMYLQEKLSPLLTA